MAPAAPATATTSTIIEKKPRGTSGQRLMFKTNVFPLSIQKKIPYYKHHLTVNIVVTVPDGKEYTRELTNSSRFYDDETRKSANVAVVHELLKQQLKNKTLIYDGTTILYSRTEIIKSQEKKITLPKSALGSNKVFSTVKEVQVAIKKATDRYLITSDEYASAAGADFVENGDKSIFQLLNIATSQCVIDHKEDCSADSNSRIYILNPKDYSLDEEKEIGDGQRLRTSIKKSVKTIENTLKGGKVVNPIPALIMDVTRTAEHKEELMSVKMKYRLNKPSLIGLKVRKTYGNEEILTVTGFTNEPVSEVSLDIEGKGLMTLPQFLESTYQVTLRETNLQGVRDRKGNIFAPELLMILPQMVTPSQNTAATSRTLILANATPPDEKMAAIESLTKALHLGGAKAKNMGVVLGKKTHALKVNGRMLAPPKLMYGNHRTSMGFTRGFQPVIREGTIDKWTFITSSDRLMAKNYDNFWTSLKAEGVALGMTIPNPTVHLSDVPAGQMAAALKSAVDKGCTYALIVSDVDGDHEAIKGAEREYGIMTQQVLGESVEKLGGDAHLNICMKMNIKNGGLNHIVIDDNLLNTRDLLIMSLVFDHPASISKKEMDDGVRPSCPAVIGISSNCTAVTIPGVILESCQNFTEKFAYSNPWEWKKEGEPAFKDIVIQLIMREVDEYMKSRRDHEGKVKPARQIIVYVSGVEEAERGYWARDGPLLVREAVDKLVKHKVSELYISIIIISTDGCERFVADKPANLTGPDPRIGLVIDSVVVNPKVDEWFLQSAKALKGTPRTIKYTVVAEYGGVIGTLDELEKLTWALTHLHQYCCGTIGIPAPSRIAGDAIKRARDLLRNFQHSTRARGPYDLEDLNTRLGFKSAMARTARSV